MFSDLPKQASQAKTSNLPLFAPRTKGRSQVDEGIPVPWIKGSWQVEYKGVPAPRTNGGWQVEYEGVPQALDTNGELFNVHRVVEAWTFANRQEAAAALDRSCRSQHHHMNYYRIVKNVH